MEESVDEMSSQNKYLKGVCEFLLGREADCINHFEEIKKYW